MKKLKISNQIFLIISVFFILYVTYFCRSSNEFIKTNLKPFSAYYELIQGRKSNEKQILLNILLFTPLGFYLPLLNFKINKRIIVAASIGLVLSVIIEILQLSTKKGEFEFDDMINNTIGSIVGASIYYCLDRIFQSKKILNVISIISSVALILFCFIYSENKQEKYSEKMIAFQLDNIDISEQLLSIDGFCFPYSKPSLKGVIILLFDKENDTFFQMETECQIPRNDIAKYYGYKFNKFGFRAYIQSALLDKEKKYEVYVRWPNTKTFSTGVYLKNDKIMCSNTFEFEKDDLYIKNISLESICCNGRLLYSSPCNDIFIFQNYHSLYLIAGENFKFDENNKTYIEYQLWTNQIMKLPKTRINNGWDWDNLGGYFEDNELIDESLKNYRVAKFDIPNTYPVTAIQVGRTESSRWIWHAEFRPFIGNGNSK